MISKCDQNIIRLASQDIPLVDEPFKELAIKLGVKESFLLSKLSSYKQDGLMRKFSATVNHRKVGFQYNAMAVWNIPEGFIDTAGNFMASLLIVSHCYQRSRPAGWKYNLYSMIHGKSKEDCLSVIKNISKIIRCKDYKVLFSSFEFKKTAAKYFTG